MSRKRRHSNATDTLLDDLTPGERVTYTPTRERAIYHGPQWSGSVFIEFIISKKEKITKAHYLEIGWEGTEVCVNCKKERIADDMVYRDEQWWCRECN